MRRRIRSVVQSDDWLKLAELLYEIYSSEQYRDLGYSSFQNFVERTKGLPKWQRAYTLCGIQKTIRDFPYIQKDARSIGTSKIALIVRRLEVTKRNNGDVQKELSRLLEIACKLSFRQLQKLISDEIDSADKDSMERCVIKFEKIPRAFKTMIVDALNEQKERSYVDGDGLALLLICKEWREDRKAEKVDTAELLGLTEPEPLTKAPPVMQKTRQ